MGFVGGTLVAFASFEVFPIALSLGGFYECMIYISFSLFFLGFVEEVDLKKNEKISKKFFLYKCLFTALENGLFGLGIGGVLELHFQNNGSLMILVAFHIFIESLEMLFSLKRKIHKNSWLLIMIFITIIPFGLCFYLGEVLFSISKRYLLIFLSMLIGKTIFTSFGIMIPKSRTIWNGRFSIYGACLGYFSFVVLSYIIN